VRDVRQFSSNITYRVKKKGERKTDSRCLSLPILLSSTFLSSRDMLGVTAAAVVRRKNTDNNQRTIYVVVVVVITVKKRIKTKKDTNYCPYFVYLRRIMMTDLRRNNKKKSFSKP
jgi:hypothetical protein